MAFNYTVDPDGNSVKGGLYCRRGTFTNGGTDTGGAILTGLSLVKNFSAITSSAAGAVQRSTISGGSVTIVTTADHDGDWQAEGYL